MTGCGRYVVLAVGLAGCARFVWHEDPFTPDEAPVTEAVVAGADTTYVARGTSYYLLARQRAALWRREVLDDVAWRYRTLFGETPPMIAVRLDTAAAPAGADASWRGVPLVVVGVRDEANERATAASRSRRDADEAPRDSVALDRLMRSRAAARAADAWLRARRQDAARAGVEGKPVGPMPAESGTAAPWPAWFETAVLATLGTSGAALRANAEVQANQKSLVPLSTLFAAAWVAQPSPVALARAFDPAAWLDDGGGVERDGRGRGRVERAISTAGGPLFVAQSVSVLSYMRERDPAAVARLADALARGRSMSDVIGASATLPRDPAALDAEWRSWVRRSVRQR